MGGQKGQEFIFESGRRAAKGLVGGRTLGVGARATELAIVASWGHRPLANLLLASAHQ